jgi:hypothetical protein
VSETATVVRERPILFSGPMVRALLNNTKTQTRRVITFHNSTVSGYGSRKLFDSLDFSGNCQVDGRAGGVSILGNGQYLHVPKPDDGTRHRVRCRWEPADVLWVRENFRGPGHIGDGDQGVVGYGIEYEADGAFRSHDDCGCEGPCSGVLIQHPLRPSIHMPRWASRIALEITDVRVQRLQDINEADILAEGVTVPIASERTGVPWGEIPTLHDAWRLCWNSINATRGYSWDSNPWVWVVEFARVLRGIEVPA